VTRGMNNETFTCDDMIETLLVFISKKGDL